MIKQVWAERKWILFSMALAALAGTMLMTKAGADMMGEPVITTADPLSLDTAGSILPLYTSAGLLMIDKKSLDLMLKDHPEARLQIVVYEEDGQGNMTRTREPECPAKMEAAMKAVAPYLNFYHKNGEIYASIFKAAPYTALEKWQDATDECWRQP